MEPTDVTLEKKTKVQIVDAIIFVSVLISSYFYQQSVNIKTLIDQEADFLNNTKLANTSFIIFNRNPKCASETIWTGGHFSAREKRKFFNHQFKV